MSQAAFIIGGGPRIGLSLANALSEKGFRVAVGRRNPGSFPASNFKMVQLDVTDGYSIERAFVEVKASVGVPNVVIYNTAALTMAPNDDPFALDITTFMKDLQVNLIGAYTAMHETVKCFKTFEPEVPKVFIATGNVVPFQPLPMAMTLGTGKAALVHLIETAVATKEYGDKSFRFYFASQVTKDGGPVPYEDVDAEAHARKYVELIEQKDQGPWDVRFVN